MDALKYLAENPFTFKDEHMDVSMGVCLTCRAMQEPHVLVYAQSSDTPHEPPEQLEYDTVEHALVGLLRAGYTLASSEPPHPSAWDFIYSIAAWRMMLPEVQVPPSTPTRTN